MPVPFTEVMEVKDFLEQQHIIVSEEWTQSCISFVKQEQGSSLSFENLKKKVRQQWLVADLEEIACSSLPQNLPTVLKVTLSNSFALQVQGIRDISRPAYAQLKELQGSVNANEEYTADHHKAVPEWEAKPNRMLLLNLTDGCTEVQGMEFQSINFLSPNLRPGIKVLIKGPIECRLGILLLTSENIRILGGEVESKLQQYSRESILKEVLGIPADENNQTESASSSNFISNGQELSDNLNSPDSYPSVSHQNGNITSISHQQSNGVRSNEDILDQFESDDYFVQNIDYERFEEMEISQREVDEGNFDYEMLEETGNNQREENKNIPSDMSADECDMWQEDEDVMRDMMEFQDRNVEFEIPFEVHDRSSSRSTDQAQLNEIFTYLSTVTNNPSANCVITIKGFILRVLSKLECTPSKGWSLNVKINDGTASVDASIHDKVLENIIGVSAQDMMKKQILAAKDADVRKEVIQTISKCKLTLQNYNCFMDVKFTPGEMACIVKVSPVNKLHIQQLLERLRTSF